MYLFFRHFDRFTLSECSLIKYGGHVFNSLRILSAVSDASGYQVTERGKKNLQILFKHIFLFNESKMQMSNLSRN